MLSSRWGASTRRKRQHEVLKILRDLWRFSASYNRRHGSSHNSSSLSYIDEGPGYPKEKFAWLVLSAGFIALTLMMGLFATFAILLVDLMKEFPAGYGSTSLVLGIQLFGFCFFGGPIGQATAKYGYQRVTLSGAAISALSLYLSSLSTELWQVMLTFGLGYGIGMALVYIPTLGIIQAWFAGKKSFAMGIAVAGTGLGAVIYTPFVEFMLTKYGWRIYIQVIAAILGVVYFIAASVYIPPRYDKMGVIKNENIKGFVDFALLKDPVIVLLCFCAIFISFAYYAPSTHIVAYAMENGISRAHAGHLIIYGGVTSFVGRIIIGNIGDFISVYYLFIVGILITGCMTALAPLYSNYVLFIVYYSVYQFFSGVYAATFPVVVAKSMGEGKFVQAHGLIRTSETASVVLSTSVAGWMKDVQGTYDYAFVVYGVIFCLSTLPIFFIPPVLAARKRKITV